MKRKRVVKRLERMRVSAKRAMEVSSKVFAMYEAGRYDALGDAILLLTVKKVVKLTQE